MIIIPVNIILFPSTSRVCIRKMVCARMIVTYMCVYRTQMNRWNHANMRSCTDGKPIAFRPNAGVDVQSYGNEFG